MPDTRPATAAIALGSNLGASADTLAAAAEHLRAHLRAFVVRPLADLDPAYPIGRHGTAAVLAAALGTEGITPM